MELQRNLPARRLLASVDATQVFANKTKQNKKAWNGNEAPAFEEDQKTERGRPCDGQEGSCLRACGFGVPGRAKINHRQSVKEQQAGGECFEAGMVATAEEWKKETEKKKRGGRGAEKDPRIGLVLCQWHEKWIN